MNFREDGCFTIKRVGRWLAVAGSEDINSEIEETRPKVLVQKMKLNPEIMDAFRNKDISFDDSVSEQDKEEIENLLNEVLSDDNSSFLKECFEYS